MARFRQAFAPWTAIFALGAWACLGPPVVVYEGPPRPLEEIAVIQTRDPSRTRVIAIDGNEIGGSIFHVEPGRHEFMIHVRTLVHMGVGSARVEMWCGLAAQLEANETYELLLTYEDTKTTAYGSSSGDVGAASGGEVKMGTKLMNVTTGVEFYQTKCELQRPRD